MTQYIYPQNLKATANLWLWSLRDFAILCVGLLISGVFQAESLPNPPRAFHINQREEVIDLGETAGALLATVNMQMQTFVSQERVSADDFPDEGNVGSPLTLLPLGS